jgi:hypothetical protein
VPSDAHIFPDALGGVTSCQDTVCADCNRMTNQQFESAATQRLASYRSMWGIAGRRGVPAVRARVSVGSWSAPVRLDQSGEPGLAVGAVPNAAGGKTYHVAGPETEVAQRIREIEEKVPGMTWREQNLKTEVTVPLESDPGALDLRRLAAKVAVERLADLRGPELVRATEFAAVGSFVVRGDEPRPIVVPVYDPAWMDGTAALAFPLPRHAVVVFGCQDDASLCAFVALFGMYHYWIVLAHPYPALASWDDLLEEDPQTGNVRSPSLRSGIGALHLPWKRWVAAWAEAPREVTQAVMRNLQRKFEAAADAFYGPDAALAHDGR